MKLIKIVLLVALTFGMLKIASAADKANTLLLDTKDGQVVIELRN